jgi:pimeloyl-ACP methyl ester carboxylesterase
VPTFAAPDGTLLGYREVGEGPTLVCVPGGPMQDADYLGDLGGLSGHRRLVLLDPRGTGRSAVPADPTSYRADRQVADLEALRVHLGLARMDVLAHSAGANLALLHLEQHPDRVARLVLVTPSVYAVGITVSDELRRATAELRATEPWFPPASAALTDVAAGRGGPGTGAALAPLFTGRWDDAARAHHAAQVGHRNDAAAGAFGATGAFDPARTRAALAALGSAETTTAAVTALPETLVLAGEVDLNSPPAAVAELAALVPRARLVVQPGAGHYPWLDDPAAFVATTVGLLARPGTRRPGQPSTERASNQVDSS